MAGIAAYLGYKATSDRTINTGMLANRRMGLIAANVAVQTAVVSWMTMAAPTGEDLQQRPGVPVPETSAGHTSVWGCAGGEEIGLLLLCSRWPQREEDRQRILSAAATKLDWPLFLRLVVHHRLAPLVSYSLSTCLRRNSLPAAEEVLGELRRMAALNAQQSLRSLAELRRITDALQSGGCAVRVLKGLPLSQAVFGDLGLRLAGDIDLLVDEASLRECDRLLRTLGYKGNLDVESWSRRRLLFYSAHWKDIVYTNAVTGSEVDLHWRCFRNRAMPGTALCATKKSETVTFGGFPVKTLPRMESLLYLCVHGMLDGWLYLKTLVDVAAQVRVMSEDELDGLAEAAVHYGILPELTATLVLVRRYLVMDHWSSRLLLASDARVAHIVRYADRVLVEEQFLAERESIPIATTLAFELGLRSNFRYRSELLVRVLFRVRMWETIPLPDFLFGLYPLLSPFEWLIFRLRSKRGTLPG
jgi:hypothetical protein